MGDDDDVDDEERKEKKMGRRVRLIKMLTVFSFHFDLDAWRASCLFNFHMFVCFNERNNFVLFVRKEGKNL